MKDNGRYVHDSTDPLLSLSHLSVGQAMTLTENTSIGQVSKLDSFQLNCIEWIELIWCMGFLEQMCEIRLFSVSVWVHVKLSQSVSQSVSQSDHSSGGINKCRQGELFNHRPVPSLRTYLSVPFKLHSSPYLILFCILIILGHEWWWWWREWDGHGCWSR